MKKQIMSALLGFALLAIMTVSAYAQAGRHVSLHIPFSFVVAGKQMPAGDYRVQRVWKDSEAALLIQSEDGRNTAMILTNASNCEPKRAELNFRLHGENYFLSSVSIPGTASVREVPRSKSEEKRVRKLIEQAKTSGGATETIVTITGSL